MTRPRLLDGCCCAGGATRGYQLAGFHVTGVDVVEHPNYCGDDFIEGDVLELDLSGYDAIHMSPPCQALTTMSNRYRGKGGVADSHVNLIAPVRARLEQTGVPWIIENVPGASTHLRNPVELTGEMFGLGVHRPRLFESNVLLLAPARPRASRSSIGVYVAAPDGQRLWTRTDGTEQRAASSVAQAAEAMGIDWMDWRELAEAIPPAYTQHLGAQLLEHLAVPA